MIASQIKAPKKAELIDITRPQPKANEVLIKVKNAGICGTDIHIWHGDYAIARYPVTPGHEFSGVISAVGDKVKNFKVGDRVTADPNIPCNICPSCQRNEQNQCENIEVVGVNRSGAFAAYITIPESGVFDIGDLSFEAAALVEPLACVVWGLKRVQIQAGDSVVIFGAGPMGILMMQAVKRAGAAVVVMIDKEAWRLELAEQLGADLALQASDLTTQSFKDIAPHGFDVVADATGVPQVIEQCFDYVRPRGKLWIFGVAPSQATASFSPFDVFRKDLTIIGSFALNKTFHEAIALIKSGAVRVKPIISHKLALEQFTEGLRIAEHDPKRMKVQFVMDKT